MTIILFKIWPTNRFSKAKSCHFHFHKNDVTCLLVQMAYSGPESCFVFVAFTFKIKVLIILKIIEWNYLLTKQNWQVYGPGTVLLFNRFGFHCLRARKVFGPFGKPAPGAASSSGASFFAWQRRARNEHIERDVWVRGSPWCDSISVRHFPKCRSSYPACTRPLFRQLFRLITLCIALC